MRKKLHSLLGMSLLITIGFSQSNYSNSNFQVGQSTYTDISGSGTIIEMIDPESGVSSSPQNIGFTFQFNGTTFTQFMIHADGILRLGTEAPGAATEISVSPANSHAAVFTSTAAGFQNVIMPFFTSLVTGEATPQFHVQTTGNAPNRVCTIQWKNLRDANNAGGGTQFQFSNLEFQVKLYETTNDIEFVYGTFNPSETPLFNRNAACGIKASNTSFIGMYRINAVMPFQKAVAFNPTNHSRINSSYPFRRDNPMIPGFTNRFFGRISNDVNVARIFYDSITPLGLQTAGRLEAQIVNEGTTNMDNVSVALSITGSNTHNAVINIGNINVGESQRVTFPDFTLINKGQQNVQVAITAAGDERSANNQASITQVVSQNHSQTLDFSSSSILGIGFNNSTGQYSAIKIYGTGTRKIRQIRLPFGSYRNLINVSIFEAGPGGGPTGAPLYRSANFLTTNENFAILSLGEGVTVTGDFFIAVQQMTTANKVWRVRIDPLKRNDRQYRGNGVAWNTDNTFPPWEVMAEVYEESAGPDIGIDSLLSPGCDYSTTDVKVRIRNFSSGLINFGSSPANIQGSVRAPDGSLADFNVVLNAGSLAPGATQELSVLNNYNFALRGQHLFQAKTVLPADVENGNDSLRFIITNNVPIGGVPANPVCPLSTVTLTGAAYLINSQWDVEGITSSGTQPLVINPIKNTIVKFRGTDYRGCLIEDSVMVTVTAENLPPKPILLDFDTILSHRNGFRDTVRVKKLEGHTIEWFGGFGDPLGDSAYALTSIGGLDGVQVAAAYRRTSDGCANLSDTITYRYIEGALQTTTAPLTVCDTAYYDAGGPTGNTGGNSIRTFVPETPGTKMKLTINRLTLAPNAALFIYDGPNASSPRIEALDPSMNGNALKEFIASNAEGVLTLEFRIGSNASAGWWGGLTCYVPEEYRTITDGPWTDPLIWESRVPGGAFTPAKRPPVKGDANIFIRHAVVLEESLAIDQVIVEPGGQFNIQQFLPQTIGLNLYKTEPNQPEILVRGRLLAEGNVSLFGRNGVIEVQNGDFANGVIVNLDSVLFTGTEKVRFGLPGKTGRINYMRMDNPAGMDVIGHQEMWGIAFRRGLINTQANAMIILREEEWFINFASNQSHINGPARVALTRNTGDRFFPIGKNGIYRPVFVRNSGSLGGDRDVIQAEVIPGPPPSRTLPPTLDAVSQVRHYRISRVAGNSGTNYRVILPYGADDGVSDHTGLSVAKDNGAGAWIDLGGTATTPAPGRITSNVFNEFSDFVLANKNGSGNPLPVNWLSFEANAVNADAHLNWRTAQEQRCADYEVERSSNGVQFTKIGNQLCRNTTAQQTYSFVDVNPGKGTFYYRLKQVDIDGKFDYSPVRKVSFGMEGRMLVYPNPARDRLMISEIPGNSDIRLFDASGRLVMQTRNAQPFGQLQVGHLPAGIYQLSITTITGERMVEKVQIVR